MNDHPWYLGAYETDDELSRKGCETILLFGCPNWKEGNPNPEKQLDGKYFDFKYVKLACPACGFVHYFKRTEWAEAQELPNFGEYKRES